MDAETEWKGNVDVLRARIRNKEDYDEANYLVVTIKTLNVDVSNDLIECFDLHVKAKFERWDEVANKLQELLRSDAQFPSKLLMYICEEYAVTSLVGIAEFRGIVHRFPPEDLFQSCHSLAETHSHHAADLWITLLMLRPDLIDIIVPTLLNCLSNGRPTFAMLDFGNTIAGYDFTGLTPQQIMFVFDIYIKAAVEKYWTRLDPTRADGLNSDEVVNNFLNETWPFFHRAMKQLGMTLLTTDVPTAVDLSSIKVPVEWSQAVIRAVAYLLAVFRLRVPCSLQDSILLPNRSVSRTMEERDDQNLPSMALDCLGRIFEDLTLDCDELSEAVELAGKEHSEMLVAYSLYHRANHEKGLSYTEYLLENDSGNVVVQAIQLSCLYMLDRTSDVLRCSVSLWEYIKDKQLFIHDADFAQRVTHLKTSFLCTEDHVAQWLVRLLIKVFTRQDVRDSDVKTCCLIVLYQLPEYEGPVATLIEEIQSSHDHFTFDGLLSYIVDGPVFSGLLEVASQTHILTDVDAAKEREGHLSRIIRFPDPTERDMLMSMANFFLEKRAQVQTIG